MYYESWKKIFLGGKQIRKIDSEISTHNLTWTHVMSYPLC